MNLNFFQVLQEVHDKALGRRAKKSGASLARGKSKQDYPTPADFMEAVAIRFGRICWDLAANSTNAKAENYFTEAVDSLAQPWHKFCHRDQWLWLNPTFDNISPWAKKCAAESQLGANILFLVPASVGSNWFAEYVHEKSNVLFLSPRLSFDGMHPYPKDCILCAYPHNRQPSYATWRWK